MMWQDIRSAVGWPLRGSAPGVSTSKYTVTVVTTAKGMDRLLPDWVDLYYTSATPNPFAHPHWLATWARHFITPGHLYVIAVRGQDGRLVGLAPFYRRRLARVPVATVVHLQLLGTGQHVHLTELPQVLIAPGLEREVLRAILQHLGTCAAEWDWLELTLPPEQGWLEPQWLPTDGPGSGSFIIHKATRPCVVLPLPSTWDELRTGLKRNVKESIRHGANSLTREGRRWHVDIPTDREGLSAGLDAIMTLHRARSGVQGKVRHPDYFADPADRAFLRDVATRMFDAGHLSPYLLNVDDTTVAGRLVLHANRTVFFSVSGFDPAWWSYNVATTLIAEGIRHAIARGDTLANLSTGPDVAKLRWSERLHLYQDFVVVGPRRRSRAAFSLFWQLRAADLVRRESQRHENA